MNTIIGLCGLSGSGKTFFAKKLAEKFSENELLVLGMDNYYKDRSHVPMERRRMGNFDHPDSIDKELLLSNLKSLIEGRSVYAPVYDFPNNTRAPEAILVRPAPVILLEGILVFAYPELMQMLDLKVFLDVDHDICVIRKLKRDICARGYDLDNIISNHKRNVHPMSNQFIIPRKMNADIIIPYCDENKIALDMLRMKVQEYLQAFQKEEKIEMGSRAHQAA